MPIRDRNRGRDLFLAGVRLASLGGGWGCGTEEDQKPVEQFQSASAVVIAATRTMLAHVNRVEQNGFIDQAVFERKMIDVPELRSYELISPDEIDVRAKALDALQAYACNLASLAQGKDVSAISDQTNSLSKALAGLSKQAANLPVSKASFLKNADFANALQAVATGVGLLARSLPGAKRTQSWKKPSKETRSPSMT